MGQFENKRKLTPIVSVSKKHPHKQTLKEEIIGLFLFFFGGYLGVPNVVHKVSKMFSMWSHKVPYGLFVLDDVLNLFVKFLSVGPLSCPK